MSHVYCPECGFQNPEASNYCSRCGALIALDQDPGGETTMTFEVDDGGEDGESLLASLGITGPALGSLRRRHGRPVVPAGEEDADRALPECDVFLDDVTVSRRHAELQRAGETFTIRDLGSLNGTYVNRHRIESATLEDDDEVQIGKYRLTFLLR